MRLIATATSTASRWTAWRSTGRARCSLGAEGTGLPQPLVDAADMRLTIPMQPPVESLNVAVAAGIILYEARRQRTTAARREADWRCQALGTGHARCGSRHAALALQSGAQQA